MKLYPIKFITHLKSTCGPIRRIEFPFGLSMTGKIEPWNNSTEPMEMSIGNLITMD